MYVVDIDYNKYNNKSIDSSYNDDSNDKSSIKDYNGNIDNNKYNTVDNSNNNSIDNSNTKLKVYWSNSKLIEALNNGSLIVFNRPELVEYSVFDRLNSLFEENRELYITERSHDNNNTIDKDDNGDNNTNITNNKHMITKNTNKVDIKDNTRLILLTEYNLSPAIEDRCYKVELEENKTITDIYKILRSNYNNKDINDNTITDNIDTYTITDNIDTYTNNINYITDNHIVNEEYIEYRNNKINNSIKYLMNKETMIIEGLRNKLLSFIHLHDNNIDDSNDNNDINNINTTYSNTENIISNINNNLLYLNNYFNNYLYENDIENMFIRILDIKDYDINNIDYNNMDIYSNDNIDINNNNTINNTTYNTTYNNDSEIKEIYNFYKEINNYKDDIDSLYNTFCNNKDNNINTTTNISFKEYIRLIEYKDKEEYKYAKSIEEYKIFYILNNKYNDSSNDGRDNMNDGRDNKYNNNTYDNNNNHINTNDNHNNLLYATALPEYSYDNNLYLKLLSYASVSDPLYLILYSINNTKRDILVELKNMYKYNRYDRDMVYRYIYNRDKYINVIEAIERKIKDRKNIINVIKEEYNCISDGYNDRDDGKDNNKNDITITITTNNNNDTNSSIYKIIYKILNNNKEYEDILTYRIIYYYNKITKNTYYSYYNILNYYYDINDKDTINNNTIKDNINNLSITNTNINNNNITIKNIITYIGIIKDIEIKEYHSELFYNILNNRKCRRSLLSNVVYECISNITYNKNNNIDLEIKNEHLDLLIKYININKNKNDDKNKDGNNKIIDGNSNKDGNNNKDITTNKDDNINNHTTDINKDRIDYRNYIYLITRDYDIKILEEFIISGTVKEFKDRLYFIIEIILLYYNKYNRNNKDNIITTNKYNRDNNITTNKNAIRGGITFSNPNHNIILHYIYNRIFDYDKILYMYNLSLQYIAYNILNKDIEGSNVVIGYLKDININVRDTCICNKDNNLDNNNDNKAKYDKNNLDNNEGNNDNNIIKVLLNRLLYNNKDSSINECGCMKWKRCRNIDISTIRKILDNIYKEYKINYNLKDYYIREVIHKENINNYNDDIDDDNNNIDNYNDNINNYNDDNNNTTNININNIELYGRKEIMIAKIFVKSINYNDELFNKLFYLILYKNIYAANDKDNNNYEYVINYIYFIMHIFTSTLTEEGTGVREGAGVDNISDIEYEEELGSDGNGDDSDNGDIEEDDGVDMENRGDKYDVDIENVEDIDDVDSGNISDGEECNIDYNKNNDDNEDGKDTNEDIDIDVEGDNNDTVDDDTNENKDIMNDNANENVEDNDEIGEVEEFITNYNDEDDNINEATEDEDTEIEENNSKDDNANDDNINDEDNEIEEIDNINDKESNSIKENDKDTIEQQISPSEYKPSPNIINAEQSTTNVAVDNYTPECYTNEGTEEGYELSAEGTEENRDRIKNTTNKNIDTNTIYNKSIDKLYNHLSYILKQNKKNKYQGNYKSGKKINMKKIIDLVVFNDTKIWMKKIYSDREYTVRLFIDNSQSMNNNNNRSNRSNRSNMNTKSNNNNINNKSNIKSNNSNNNNKSNNNTYDNNINTITENNSVKEITENTYKMLYKTLKRFNINVEMYRFGEKLTKLSLHEDNNIHTNTYDNNNISFIEKDTDVNFINDYTDGINIIISDGLFHSVLPVSNNFLLVIVDSNIININKVRIDNDMNINTSNNRFDNNSNINTNANIRIIRYLDSLYINYVIVNNIEEIEDKIIEGIDKMFRNII